MSHHDAIMDAGESLIKLLEQNIKEDTDTYSVFKPENAIILSSPDELNSNDKKISLFLYNIIENSYLRNQNEYIPDSNNKNSPLNLSLFYLITPHTESIQNDQILLGKILQIFHDNAILRGSVLQGSLTGQELRLILNHFSVDELNKLWSIVSGSKPYKLSICIEVTPVRIDSTKEQKVIRVIERDLEYTVPGEVHDND
ncbi:DUF4255 domain-containing protein [Methanobacterium formicicum]|uniref:DUF4255 domain-containing protein n=1 Tax=Methanobacterium formicicum TaxID=2162 RepID=UPI0024128A70|nr:DUF4255 domain-containing protein [Methanobacterium formicicum]MDG3548126.1 DUF4255 domain-containing protein [Methanobacterium formicicum]